MRHLPLFALLALSMAAPAVFADESKPWSQILLGKPKLSDPDEVQLVMVGIDGKRDFTPETLYQLSPGKHEFSVATTKIGSLGELTYLIFSIDMQPCTTYELVGEQQRATSQNNRRWIPILKSMPQIKRCLRKFGIAPSQAPMPVITP